MRAISAADAITPAVERTKAFLFRPFSWGTFLKLGLVALVTEGLGSNFRGSSSRSGGGGGSSLGRGPMIHSLRDIPPQWIAAGVAAFLLVLLIAAVVFYLITRLRFAFFHCLVHNTKMIRPGWDLYKEQASRFFWLNIGVGVGFLLLMGLISIPFVAGFLRLFRDMQPGGHPNIGMLLGLILPLVPIILLLVVLGIALDIILRDWMLPHFALEDASASDAWSSVWARITAEKGQFFAYALLRLILPMVAGIAIFLILLIPGLVLAGAVAGMELGIHSAFADSTGSASVAGIMLQVFFGLVAFGFFLLASICLGGPLSTGTREYAILFYGGRYQVLGDLLYPQPLPPSPIPAGVPVV
ncbi:hypothetical protein P8935_06135 [Telmatobacter sp. DSM 110680]|uniref:DUF4013 domain-containing protein n=1 Tax=Telmatobacter sp. DSM 110680 TaxID=3036704 RepID=A0AAU7DNK0_9BACT